MQNSLKVYLSNNDDFDSLHRWLIDVRDIDVTPTAKPIEEGRQGGAWDFLSVACGSGGAMTIAIRAIIAWVDSRVTEVKVKINNDEFQIKTNDPESVVELLKATRKTDQTGS